MAYDSAPPLQAVTASLTYLVPMIEKPVSYNYEPPPGTPWRTGLYAPRTVSIRNGRAIEPGPSLDAEGFVLTRHQSSVGDFYAPREVESAYHAEVEQLVKQVTGATKVVVFDTTLRSGKPIEGRTSVKEPARRVHNDYTEASGPQRVRDLLSPAEAEAWLKGRFAVINVWRPIRGPVQEAPLALCDARSIAPADLVPTDLKYPDRTERSTRSHSTRIIAGITSRRCSATRSSSSNATTLRATAGRASPRTVRSTIRPRRPTPRRAKASRPGHWPFSPERR